MDLAVTGAPGRRAARIGFSLLEVLVASAILLIIIIGLLPLFTQGLISNTAGAESTDVSNFGRSRVEDYLQRPFNSAELTIDAGSAKQVDEHYTLDGREWQPGLPPDGVAALWLRTTVVRQYGVSALEDEALDPTEALPAGTDAALVHLKEIEVTVAGTRAGGPLGPAKRLTLRVLKFK